MFAKCSRSPQTSTQSVPARSYSARQRLAKTSSGTAIDATAGSRSSGLTSRRTTAIGDSLHQDERPRSGWSQSAAGKPAGTITGNVSGNETPMQTAWSAAPPSALGVSSLCRGRRGPPDDKLCPGRHGLALDTNIALTTATEFAPATPVGNIDSLVTLSRPSVGT